MIIKENMKTSKSNRSIFQFVMVFLSLSLIYSIMVSWMQNNINKIQKQDIINSEQIAVNVDKTVINNAFDRLVSDLVYIYNTLEIEDGLESNYIKVKEQWVAFADSKKRYDQIRLIDLNGDEKIRINYSEEGSYVVGDEDLQNKQDRIYFQEAIKLDANSVYISKADLNVENGEIEIPIKPMIHLAKPYYVNNVVEGIIVLNYYANDIIEQISNISSTSQSSLYLLNSDGYWIYNKDDRSREWGFMYDDKLDMSFKNEYPEEWEKMTTGSEETFVTRRGVFSYVSVNSNSMSFLKDTSSCKVVFETGNWRIISHIPASTEKGQLFTNTFFESFWQLVQSNYYIYLLILIISVIISRLLFINKVEIDKVKYYSEFDEMTGVYNRRAGFKKLAQIDASKTSCTISICFVDINGLKEVNDSFGHDTGDELIKTVVFGIKENIRNDDFITRLGGDEFLIVFSGITKNEAEAIWDRIQKYYDEVNDKNDKKYIISASHGIETFFCNSQKKIDDIINNADERMYLEKKKIKKNLSVIK